MQFPSLQSMRTTSIQGSQVMLCAPAGCRVSIPSPTLDYQRVPFSLLQRKCIDDHLFPALKIAAPLIFSPCVQTKRNDLFCPSVQQSAMLEVIMNCLVGGCSLLLLQKLELFALHPSSMPVLLLWSTYYFFPLTIVSHIANWSNPLRSNRR